MGSLAKTINSLDQLDIAPSFENVAMIASHYLQLLYFGLASLLWFH